MNSSIAYKIPTKASLVEFLTSRGLEAEKQRLRASTQKEGHYQKGYRDALDLVREVIEKSDMPEILQPNDES